MTNTLHFLFLGLMLVLSIALANSEEKANIVVGDPTDAAVLERARALFKNRMAVAR